MSGYVICVQEVGLPEKKLTRVLPSTNEDGARSLRGHLVRPVSGDFSSGFSRASRPRKTFPKSAPAPVRRGRNGTHGATKPKPGTRVFAVFSDDCVSVREAHRTINTPGRDRTCDLRFRKPSLYPLSYGGGTSAVPTARF
jgi:hypothetical protein